MIKVRKKNKILYGSIFILSTVIALYFYPENKNTTIVPEPQNIKKEIPKYYNANKINVYNRFKGSISSYEKNGSNVILEVLKNDGNIEHIKITENVLKLNLYKINDINYFEFVCNSRNNNILENCELY